MKSKIFETILTQVAEVTEISKETIIGKTKSSDVIEARILVIYYCKSYGLSNQYIKEKLSRKSLFSIANLLNSYYICHKTSYSFRQLSDEVQQRIASIMTKINQ